MNDNKDLDKQDEETEEEYSIKQKSYWKQAFDEQMQDGYLKIIISFVADQKILIGLLLALFFLTGGRISGFINVVVYTWMAYAIIPILVAIFTWPLISERVDNVKMYKIQVLDWFNNDTGEKLESSEDIEEAFKQGYDLTFNINEWVVGQKVYDEKVEKEGGEVIETDSGLVIPDQYNPDTKTMFAHWLPELSSIELIQYKQKVNKAREKEIEQYLKGAIAESNAENSLIESQIDIMLEIVNTIADNGKITKTQMEKIFKEHSDDDEEISLSDVMDQMEDEDIDLTQIQNN